MTTLGLRLKEVRLAQGMTLAALAEASALTKGFLSQVENNRATPSLASLRRLAQSLQVPVEALIPSDVRATEKEPEKSTEPRIIRRAEWDGPGSRLVQLPGAAGQTLASVRLNGGAFLTGSSQDDVAQGAILCFVAEGSIILNFANSSVALHAGDSAAIPTSAPYTLRNGNLAPALLLISSDQGTALPVLVESRRPAALVAHRGPTTREYAPDGPFRLVAMRAERAARQGG